MESNVNKYRKDLDDLIATGEFLRLALLWEIQLPNMNIKDEKTIKIVKDYPFRDNYNSWYNESIALIKQLMSDRLNDFTSYYKVPNRKTFNVHSYTISDYMVGASFKTNDWKYLLYAKYSDQYKIIKSLKSRFDSSLYEIKELLQSDLFDSELDAAKELQKKGFLRATGAICGVVIERHLSQVCERRGIKVTKKNPAINDYKSLLQTNNVIDVQQMRQIELMADIRNKCDHSKNVEPTNDDITDIIEGTNKIIKSIY